MTDGDVKPHYVRGTSGISDLPRKYETMFNFSECTYILKRRIYAVVEIKGAPCVHVLAAE